MKLSNPLQRLRFQDTSTRVFWLTSVGVAISIIPLIQYVVYFTVLLTQNTLVYFTSSLYLSAFFLVWPLVYCIPASLLFRPKRLISPLYIQVGTFVVGLLLALDYWIRGSFYTVRVTVPEFIVNLILMGSITFMILLVIGLAQTALVRWVVALNFSDLDKETYAVTVDTKTLRDAMDSSFLDAWGLTQVSDSGGVLLLRMRYASGETHIFALTENPNNRNKSLLAWVSYNHGFYSISKWEGAAGTRDTVIASLIGKLTVEHPDIAFKPIGTFSDNASIRAWVLGLQPTQSKVGVGWKFLREIPRYYRYAIGLSGATLVGLTLIFATQYLRLDFGTYISTAVFVGLTLVAEFGLALRQEIAGRKEE